MKYIANPVIVDALVITHVEDKQDDLEYTLTLENGQLVQCGIDMYIRHEPKVGDYWVTQEDGYVYLNPKDVFERKYAPAKS